MPRYDDFHTISQIGEQLAELHLNYDQQPPHPSVRLEDSELNIRNDQQRYSISGGKIKLNKKDRSIIHFNTGIQLTNIPLQAYDYQVNGKSAIEWIIDRYEVKEDTDTRIPQNPHEWQPENPRYVLDLLQSIIHLSTQTQDLLAALPPLNIA